MRASFLIIAAASCALLAADAGLGRQILLVYGESGGGRILRTLDSIEAMGYPASAFEDKVREGMVKLKTADQIVQALEWKKGCAARANAASASEGDFEHRLLKEEIRSAEQAPDPAPAPAPATHASVKTKVLPAASSVAAPQVVEPRSASPDVEDRLVRQALHKQEMLLKKVEKQQERQERKIEKSSSHRK